LHGVQKDEPMSVDKVLDFLAERRWVSDALIKQLRSKLPKKNNENYVEDVIIFLLKKKHVTEPQAWKLRDKFVSSPRGDTKPEPSVPSVSDRDNHQDVTQAKDSNLATPAIQTQPDQLPKEDKLVPSEDAIPNTSSKPAAKTPTEGAGDGPPQQPAPPAITGNQVKNSATEEDISIPAESSNQELDRKVLKALADHNKQLPKMDDVVVMEAHSPQPPPRPAPENQVESSSLMSNAPLLESDARISSGLPVTNIPARTDIQVKTHSERTTKGVSPLVLVLVISVLGISGFNSIQVWMLKDTILTASANGLFQQTQTALQDPAKEEKEGAAGGESAAPVNAGGNNRPTENMKDLEQTIRQLQQQMQQGFRQILERGQLINGFLSGTYEFDLPKSDQPLQFIFIPAGEFTFGYTEKDLPRLVDVLNSENDPGAPIAGHNAKPAVQIRVETGFFILKHEVTEGQFAVFEQSVKKDGQANPARNARNAYLPVTEVTWLQARDFCLWVSDLSGHTVRLPTEIEWEYSARGPWEQPFPWPGNDFHGWANKQAPRAVNVQDNTDKSWRGVLDMSANVREWCVDRENKNLHAEALKIAKDTKGWNGSYQYDPASNLFLENAYKNDPMEPRPFRIFRGGSFSDLPGRCEVSGRRNQQQNNASEEVGFRPVLVMKQGK
jgi:formylglycine-generating enzyme required for sulfatase activity